jgi:hypothetical protein
MFDNRDKQLKDLETNYTAFIDAKSFRRKPSRHSR